MKPSEVEFFMLNNHILDHPRISLVVPVYNEAQGLQSNALVIRDWLDKSGVPYEIIIVDDGSTDSTWSICSRLSKDLPELRALRFSRNFGKEAAILCGLREAVGEAAIVIDSDLQHPPELIPEMVERWQKENFDLVEAVKISRGNEPFYRRWLAHSFYRAMRFLSGYDLAGAADFKLLSRRAIDAYINMPETNRFFRGLVAWLGFKKDKVPFNIPSDKSRRSRWSFGKLVRLSLGAITAFSYIPLQLITFIGFITFILSFILILQTLYMKFSGNAVEGFTTVILVVLFIGSVIMLSLGVIGEYLARIYEELKRRPNYVIMERIGADRSPSQHIGAEESLRTT